MRFIIHSRNQINSNQIKCWFERRGENRSTRRKTSRSRVENQQTSQQPTYDAESGNRTRTTLVGGECSHHCATLLPSCSLSYCQFFSFLASRNLNKCVKFILYTDTDDHVLCNETVNLSALISGCQLCK